MCFSLKVETNLNHLKKITGAKILWEEFHKIPDLQKRAKNAIKFAKDERLKKNQELFLETQIYPNFMAPILIKQNRQLLIRPMRFQLVPSFAKEAVYRAMPETKKRKGKILSTYNARIDRLQQNTTWKRLIGRTQGILFSKSFFEYVSSNGKATLVEFFLPKIKLLSTAVIFDHWQDKSDSSFAFYSFAVITKAPNPEILKAGHDRMPLFLNGKETRAWLDLENQDLQKKDLEKLPLHFQVREALSTNDK